MTPLRQRMTQALQLRGYSDRTVEAYVRAVVQLANFFHVSPDEITEEQVRQYLLHLSTVQKVARGTFTIALCGIKFFYQQTLGRPWTVLDVVRPKGEKKLPVVLSRNEVWRVLDALRTPVDRVCLTTIYACGVRLMEGIRLQVPDIDGERKVLHIHGKRGKDRYVPLPDGTLALLRAHWRTHRNPLWLFPTSTRNHAAPLNDPTIGPISDAKCPSRYGHRVADVLGRGSLATCLISRCECVTGPRCEPPRTRTVHAANSLRTRSRFRDRSARQRAVLLLLMQPTLRRSVEGDGQPNGHFGLMPARPFTEEGVTHSDLAPATFSCYCRVRISTALQASSREVMSLPRSVGLLSFDTSQQSGATSHAIH